MDYVRLLCTYTYVDIYDWKICSWRSYNVATNVDSIRHGEINN